MSEVLIVGAGPTGLALAYELTRRNVGVRIIDEREGPSTQSKALGIQSRTLELFEKMGILNSFLEKGMKVKGVLYHWKNKQVHLDLNELQAPYPFVLILPQAETEKILIKHLEEMGILVQWNTKLLDIIENQSIIRNPQNEKEVDRSSWIVGCDGAHSQVRHLLKFSFKGVKLPENFVLADVEAETSTPIDCPHIFLNKNGFGILIPISQTMFRLIFPQSKKIEREIDEKDLFFFLKARGFTEAFKIKKIHWVSEFYIHRRISSKLRKENVFLAGDASHIHSPAGGQGMNTSIQDAFNLAWKLALVIQRVSPDSILNSYETERYPIAKKVLKGTTRFTKFLTFSQKWNPALFYLWLKFITKSKKIRLKLLNAISELSVSYPKGFLIHEVKRDEGWSKGPKPGQRAPDIRLANGKRLFELLKSKNHVLLLFAQHPEFISAIQREYGQCIDVHVLEGEEVRQRYAAGSDTLYLIRPDGYVGYRSRTFKTEEVISYFLRVFKPSSQRNKS